MRALLPIALLGIVAATALLAVLGYLSLRQWEASASGCARSSSATPSARSTS